MRYSGRDFSDVEIQWMRNLMAGDPTLTRVQLSRIVCKQLKWLKPNGELKDMSCRVAMLRMQDDGLIRLPKPKKKHTPPCASKNIIFTEKTAEQSPCQKPVHHFKHIELTLVNKNNSKLWNEYIQRYHYLGYAPLPGAQLRYFAIADNNIVGLLGFGASAWKTAPRDNFIGWSQTQREKNLQLIVNNARFLILPWVQSKNLASKLLGLIAKQLPHDWSHRYNYKPVLLETFVETQRFLGTCYKAANWVCVGRTAGRGKLDPQKKALLPKKDIWLYPLQKDFRNILLK